MPQVRNYRVVETREVEVRANSAVDASRLAAAAFEYGQDSDGGIAMGKSPEGVWGNTTSRVRTIDLSTSEN